MVKGTRLVVTNNAGEIVITTWDRSAVRIQANHSTREKIDISRRQSIERILAFHGAIVAASKSRTLVTLMHALEHALLNLFNAVEPQPANRYKSLKSILNKIAARDSEGAYAAMRAHLLDRRKSMIYRLKQTAGYSLGQSGPSFGFSDESKPA